MTRRLFATQSLYSTMLLRRYHTSIFVFGDNQARVGKGGQAIIRDHPNARGIATKRIDLSFMQGSLKDFEAVLRDIRNIEAIMDSGQQVILPILENGDISIGCGLADLPRQAPSVYGMLNDWFHDLEGVKLVKIFP